MDQDNVELLISVPEIKKDTYLLVDNNVYIVTEKTTHKTGKHGSAKSIIKLRDVFTGKNHVIAKSTKNKLEVPKIEKNDYDLLDIDDDGNLSLLSLKTKEVVNIKNDEKDLHEKLKKMLSKDQITLTLLEAKNLNKIVSFRKMNEDE